jgi:streptomycin 6-kinase
MFDAVGHEASDSNPGRPHRPGQPALRPLTRPCLLDHGADTGTMLLERLDAARPLKSMAEDTTAVQILAELVARLVAVPAPEGLRHLAGIAAAMLGQTPRALPALRGPGRATTDAELRVRHGRADQRTRRPPAALATGEIARTVPRRFDLLTEVAGLDRQRATGWTPWPHPAERAGAVSARGCLAACGR